MKRITTVIACLLTAAAIVSCSKASPNDNETDRPSGTSAEITDTNAPAAGTDAPETKPSEDIPASPASDFQYEISEEGDSIYITRYIGTDENVVIPSEIDGLPVYSLRGVKNDDGEYTYITEGVFEKCSVKTVKIPDTVAVIGLRAFTDCKELTDVSVPGSVDRLFDYAFENCTKLEKIDLSETKIKIVEGDAFNGCTGLTEVKLPASLLEIGDRAFYDCTSLLEIHLPENLTDVGKEAFRNCTSLKTITVPTKLKLQNLDGFVFFNMPSLEKIIFEEGREEIDGYVFFVITSDAKIIIPTSVKKFSPYPFAADGSAKIFFSGDCPEFVETSVFYGDATLYYDPDTKGWDNCEGADGYMIEPLVKEAGRHGENSEFEYEISENGDAVYLTKYIGTDENVVIPSEIDGIPVYSLQGTVDDEYHTIVEGVFENSAVKTVTIPEGVAVIERNAFRNCAELTSVSIPRSIEKISTGAFKDCAKLEKMDLSGTKITVLSGYVFSGCTALREIGFPAGLRRIDPEAFRGCSSLSEIILPESLVKIQDLAFYECTSISEIRLPENLSYVGEEAFAECSSLKTVTICTKGEIFFGTFGFGDAPLLEKIIFEEGCERLTGEDCFFITSYADIIIPESVKAFSPALFRVTGAAKFFFSGDFPELLETDEFFSEDGGELDLTICYDPTAKGWDNCVWKDKYTLEPIS